ncbi:MAG TPA: hypothetical protein HPP77_08050 [Candidatus Hydrogenedentes bacterium]|nr:hypothetical protein [Candidatus Hydrogenedentota bacterium]HIJ73962.1 hypothetical protein [Candidatus Hydrogenedentota bacterium]
MRDMDATRYELRTVYARQSASAGVHAAIGEIARALSVGEMPKEEFEFEFPVYVKYDEKSEAEFASVKREEKEGEAAELEPLFNVLAQRKALAKVTVRDESAKVDLNHVPRAALEALPGLDRATAREIKSVLPRTNEDVGLAADDERRWFSSVDDLVVRGIVAPAVFDDLDKDLFTVYSGYDLDHPEGVINLNSAPAEVLAAVLGVDIATAEAVVVARPFNTLAEVCAAAGKDPATLNVPASLLALRSCCFRIRSEARYVTVSEEGVGFRPITQTVEAVVVFDPEGRNPKIRFWRSDLVVVGDAASEEGTGAEPA